MTTMLLRVFSSLVTGAAFLSAPFALAQESKATFSNEQLDQMLAPIALYPDSLLAQVLMASTYPADVAAAAQWSKANPNEKGDEAVKKVESKDWDPSVQSLVAFPQALAMMGDKPDWVQQVGDAFLAQPDRVMDRVQFLRKKAQEAGNLKSSEQQKVMTETVPAAAPAQQATAEAAPPPATSTQTIIKIEPANPQVVYVPSYNPTVVYGPWWYPAYPPFYWPPPPFYGVGAAVAGGIAFGIGVGITASLWGGCDWGRGDVNINVNKYNSLNVNKQINASNTKWEHNAANRKGVPYKDGATREKFDKKLAGADSREQFRGKPDARDEARNRAQDTLKDRGADPAVGREKLQGADRDKARDAVQGADRGRPDGGDRGPGATDRGGQLGQAGDRGGGQLGQGGGQLGQGGSQFGQGGGKDNALAGIGNPAQDRQATDRGRESQATAKAGGGGQHSGGGGGAQRAGAAGGAKPSAGGGGGHRAGAAGGARPSAGGGGARGGGGGRRR